MKNFHSFKGTNGGIYKREFKMDSNFRQAAGVILFFWALGVLASLGVVGVVIWAIIRLVSKYG